MDTEKKDQLTKDFRAIDEMLNELENKKGLTKLDLKKIQLDVIDILSSVISNLTQDDIELLNSKLDTIKKLGQRIKNEN